MSTKNGRGGITGIFKEADEAMTDRQKIEAALDVIEKYGGIDGDHHKAWVIDQVARALNGDEYDEWVREMCDGEDGPATYEWEPGIAP